MASSLAGPAMDLITLPHHAEFLSDRWLDEAGKFLREQMPLRRAMLAGPFSISERFTDTPPHMKLPGDVAEYTLRFDGQDAVVARGFDANADLTVQGDYQAALYAAQFVGVAVPGGAKEMMRELVHMFGKDALRVSGRIEDEQARLLLDLLHDHMARRTVENPDIEHRARRLGLTANIREMHEQGYTILERAITDDFADEVRAAIKRMVQPGQGVSMGRMLYQGREFERITLNPKLMTLVDASLGRGAALASHAAIVRGPGKGLFDIHDDYTDVPEPYPDYAMAGVGVWAFEKWTTESGPTWIIPGSHRKKRAPRPGEGSNEGVPAEMPKGSVVFFTQGVWHWQGDRTEPGERVSLHPHFNRGILRNVEQKAPDLQLFNRNPPRLGEMLGEDDWFDKITPTGRDYMRLEHMRQLHAFTRHKMKAVLGAQEAEAA